MRVSVCVCWYVQFSTDIYVCVCGWCVCVCLCGVTVCVCMFVLVWVCVFYGRKWGV